MDKKFLHKVVDQIVSETEIDYDKKEIYLPFFHSRPITVFRFLSLFHSLDLSINTVKISMV